MLRKILMDKEGEGGAGGGAAAPVVPAPGAAAVPEPGAKPAVEPEVKPYEFNSDNYVMKVDGKEIKVSSQEELTRLLQMGQDYTNKTKSLATDRAKMVAEIETRAKTLFEAARKAEGTKGEEPDPEDEQSVQAKEIAELRSKLESMEKGSASKEANAQLDTLLSTLHDTHKGLSKLDEKIIIMRFNEQVNDESDTPTLFDSLFAERLKENAANEQKIIQKFIEDKAKDPFAGGETGKSGTPGAELAKTPKTFADARVRSDARIEAARRT